MKRYERVFLGVGLSVAAAEGCMLIGGSWRFARADDQGPDSRVQQGFNIAPVPLDLTGKNPHLVGLGSYLVNAVGGCNDCHTNPPYAPGNNPYLGQPKIFNAATYLAGGTSFGPFVSRNLTPDPAKGGLPAGLTFDQFRNVIRTGQDPVNPGKLLQVMPWPVYQSLTDQDLLAVYTYLSAIPSACAPSIVCRP